MHDKRLKYVRLYRLLACTQGHEDLRQDERVMQLFGLVNTMLVRVCACVVVGVM